MSVLTTCRSLEELTENAQRACNLFLAECKAQGLNVLITETYRSQARQDYLYSQGRTRVGKKVTWTKKSRHTSRRAWDICKNVKGQEYSDNDFFKTCGKIAKKYGITWGGEWKTPDYPHFEIDENWKYEGDELDMDKLKELEKKISKLETEIANLKKPEMIYNYIDKNMPEWSRESVKYFVDNGVLHGTGNGLGLSDIKLWVLTILYRIIKNIIKKA